MSRSLHGRRFTAASGGVDVSADTVFVFSEDRLSGVVTASYSGGSVLAGSLVGTRDGLRVEFRYSHVTRAGSVESGVSQDRIELLDDGRLRLHETWEWTSRAGSGVSTLEELPGPRYVKARVARPVASLDASVAFYSGLLGLAGTGSFQDHAGYDGVFLALPGGGELELTMGPSLSVPATPGSPGSPGSPDDLLCLYLATSADVAALAAALPASVSRVAAQNPYWEDFGVTVLDPDGYRIVLTAPPGE